MFISRPNKLNIFSIQNFIYIFKTVFCILNLSFLKEAIHILSHLWLSLLLPQIEPNEYFLLLLSEPPVLADVVTCALGKPEVTIFGDLLDAPSRNAAGRKGLHDGLLSALHIITSSNVSSCGNKQMTRFFPLFIA